MKTSFVALALAAFAVASPAPQGVTSALAPKSSAAPSGCSDTRDGKFTITVVNVTSSAKRSVEKRQLAGTLTLSLSGGDLKDQAGRTGYIAANYQFQFDNPPQTGALITTGFSVCSNNSLALGGSAIFYQCYSGGFFNLYDRSWAPHCVPIYIVAQGGSGGVTQATDGQPGAPTAPVSVISDGQPQVPTGVTITQITDGQPQVPTGAPVSEITDGQIQATSAGAPVSEISDGQPQVPTGAPVSEISDGQPQVPTGAPVSEISDGQPQVPTGAPVSQLSDGQPQVVTGAPTPVITGAPVSQISDGQVQAPTGGAAVTGGNATITTGAPAQYTGAAASPVYALGALVAGMMGVVAML